MVKNFVLFVVQNCKVKMFKYREKLIQETIKYFKEDLDISKKTACEYLEGLFLLFKNTMIYFNHGI